MLNTVNNKTLESLS